MGQHIPCPRGLCQLGANADWRCFVLLSLGSGEPPTWRPPNRSGPWLSWSFCGSLRWPSAPTATCCDTPGPRWQPVTRMANPMVAVGLGVPLLGGEAAHNHGGRGHPYHNAYRCGPCLTGRLDRRGQATGTMQRHTRTKETLATSD